MQGLCFALSVQNHVNLSFFFSLSNFCSQFENFCIFKYLTNNCAQNGIRIAIPHQKKYAHEYVKQETCLLNAKLTTLTKAMAEVYEITLEIKTPLHFHLMWNKYKIIALNSFIYNSKFGFCKLKNNNNFQSSYSCDLFLHPHTIHKSINLLS